MVYGTTSHTFYEELTKSIKEAEEMCVIIFRLDIDKININQHEELIGLVHSRLRQNLRKFDLVSRIERDAFVVVMKTLASNEKLEPRISELAATVNKPYDLDSNTRHDVKLSVGYAIRNVNEKPSSILKRADDAMGRAKELAST